MTFSSNIFYVIKHIITNKNKKLHKLFCIYLLSTIKNEKNPYSTCI
jgi:hypothetical protein